jgi:DNA modification methylase
MNECKIIIGDCIDMMRTLPDESVNCCVTSPPYFGLRDYGHDGQIGLEPTPEAFVAKLVAAFREVRRVLREDGTLWLNLGDSYARSAGPEESKLASLHTMGVGQRKAHEMGAMRKGKNRPPEGLKPKDLIGIPWRVAFALQADGWYLRQDIIWHKPNPMPESVTDRCTKSHEYMFLLTKSARYWYDAEAIKEESTGNTKGAAASFKRSGSKRGESICPNSPMPTHREDRDDVAYDGDTRNKRSVWTVATQPYSGAHFATFPPDLIRPCIRAGCPIGGTVLDPFGGSGTTGMVALEESRSAILCELNPAYAEIAKGRTNVTPGLGI